jgi:general secretion pathway protein K
MGKLKMRRKQSGAALLLALLIMTLVATLAAGMVWLQWRGIEVEAAERARTQAEWLLNASLDWGNLILKSSIRNNHTEDDLGQPWATPLEETKLSSFLSADGNHQDDTGPEAYLSGQITDAEGKYNVYNIVLDPTKFEEINRLKIICQAVGVPADTADAIGSGLRESSNAVTNSAQGGQAGTTPNGDSVLMPVQVEDLAWYGVDPKVLLQLKPFIELLPPATTPVPGQPAVLSTINANTAPPEVLMAALPGITRAQAQQIILRRQAKPLASLNDVWTALGSSSAAQWQNPQPSPSPQANQAAVLSNHFEIFGQLRYEQHVIRELSVIYRDPNPFAPIKVLRRERLPPDPA